MFVMCSVGLYTAASLCWGCSGSKDVWYMASLLHYFDLLSILYTGRSMLWQNVIKPLN